MLKEAIISSLVGEGLETIKKVLAPKKMHLVNDKESLVESIFYHNNFILNSTKLVQFKNSLRVSYLKDLFVHLNCEFQARRNKSKEQETPFQNLTQIVNETKSHIVLLGGPGSGKTSTINYLAHQLINFDINVNYSFPILIKLRTLQKDTVFTKLKSIIGLDFVIRSTKNEIVIEQKILDKILLRYLDSLNCIVILDGLDEVSPRKFEEIFPEIEELTSNLSNSLVILTCRLASYSKNITNSFEYEIQDFNKPKITEFISKWFYDKNQKFKDKFGEYLENSRFIDYKKEAIIDNIAIAKLKDFVLKSVSGYDSKIETTLLFNKIKHYNIPFKQFYNVVENLLGDSNNLLHKIEQHDKVYIKSTNNTLEFLKKRSFCSQLGIWNEDERQQIVKNFEIKFYIRPITLTQLCVIYDMTNKFYNNPRFLYRKLVSLYIDEWDEQRGIGRKSRFDDFDSEEKRDFLYQISYLLTINYENKIYSGDEWLNIYNKTYSRFGLPKHLGLDVLSEIEEHTGIILKTSYDSYEYIHKTFQEYLCGEYLVKTRKLPIEEIKLKKLSNELAISIGLSSEPSFDFFDLIFVTFQQNDFDNVFLIEFLSRIAYEAPKFEVSLLFPFSFIFLAEKWEKNDILIKNLGLQIERLREIDAVEKSFEKFSNCYRHRFDENLTYLYPNKNLMKLITQEEMIYLDISEKMIVSTDFYKRYFFNIFINK